MCDGNIPLLLLRLMRGHGTLVSDRTPQRTKSSDKNTFYAATGFIQANLWIIVVELLHNIVPLAPRVDVLGVHQPRPHLVEVVGVFDGHDDGKDVGGILRRN